jgi:hypothetical protein
MKAKDMIAIIMFRVLELAFVGAFLAVLILVLKKEVPAGNKDLINIMLGILGTCVVGIAGYEWGSSRGSDQKTQMLYDSTPTTPAGTPGTVTESKIEKTVTTDTPSEPEKPII